MMKQFSPSTRLIQANKKLIGKQIIVTEAHQILINVSATNEQVRWMWAKMPILSLIISLIWFDKMIYSVWYYNVKSEYGHFSKVFRENSAGVEQLK